MNTMQARPRGRSARLAAIVLSLAVLAATEVGSQDPKRSCPISGDVAQAFRNLEAALVARDAPRAESFANTLAGRARVAARRKPAAEDADPAPADLATALADAASAAAARAGTGDLPGAGKATVRTTQACIACHVRRRPEEIEKQAFPARGNTIWGRVSITDVAGKPRKDASGVVVFLDEVRGATPPEYAVAPPFVSQKGRKFSPSVLPIVIGSAIEFPNDDKIFHNVFSLSKTHPFDLGIYERGKTKSVRPKRTGLIKVYCNIHSDMQCSILVLQNPCFSVTDTDGSYLITGVPDGTYSLRIWNNLGGGTDRRVAVAGSAATRVDFRIRETKRAASHLNKWGKRYRKKY